MNIGKDDFKIKVCEELFGCHIFDTVDDLMLRIHRCACCDKIIDIRAWVHAEHEPDCIIIDVRDYLALHKPEVVRARGKDWVSRFSATVDKRNQGT